MIQYLTPEQVLFIHSQLVIETGGAHGVRDIPMLLSAVGRPQATFDGDDLYPDIFLKTAALMDSLIRNHPFMDGNKRTAITAAGIFIKLNGYDLIVENNEMVRFTLACAMSQNSLKQITQWFIQYSTADKK